MLETERLLLRQPQLADLDRWAEMMADEESARFVGGVQELPIVWRNMMTQAGAWALTGVAMFSVVNKQTGMWIGRVGPWQPLGWPGTEVGWGLHRDSWGQGFAHEAATAAMDYAFDVLGWTDIVHCINPDNMPSARLALRLGSRNRGSTRLPAPYQYDEIDLWGQTREEWKARQ